MAKRACLLTACFLLGAAYALCTFAQTSSEPAKPQESKRFDFQESASPKLQESQPASPRETIRSKPPEDAPGRSPQSATAPSRESTSLKPEESPPLKPQESASVAYPVTLNGRTIFFVKGEVAGYSAKERAKTVTEGVKTVTEDYAIPIHSIGLSHYEGPVTLIVAQDKRIVGLYDEDIQGENRSRDKIAAEYAQKLRSAIERYREDFSRKRVLISCIYLLIATIVLIVLLYLLNRLDRICDAKLQAWVEAKKVSIRIQSLNLVRTEHIKTTLVEVLKIIRFAAMAIALYMYAHLGLSFFPWTRVLSGQLLSYLLVPLTAMGKAILAEIPNLVILAISVVITYFAVRLTRLFFSEIEKGTVSFKGFYPEWGQPTYKIVRILITAFAVVAFSYVPGSQSPAFKGISIFFGVLFSLGSTSAIANILAGYMLTYRIIFKVGDRVRLLISWGT